MSPTHDMIIDNSTGANVRADINNALAALVSNSSSSSEPSTKYAYQFWADTTTGILKIRNAANNAWVELLQLDGTLTLEDGSASTPGLAFRDDLNTGIYSSAADTFDIATAGTQRLTVDSSGRLLQGKGATKASTGEVVPTFCNEIASNNPNVFEIANNGTNAANSYSALVLSRSDSTSVNGHTAVDSGDQIGEVCFIGADGSDRFNTAAAIKAFANADFTANNCPAFLTFHTNGGSASASERLRIDSSGHVGIGTTSPSSFDVEGDDLVVSTSGHTGITINSGSAGSTSRGSIYFAEGTAGSADKTRAAIQYQHGDDFMRFITNTSERLRIDSSGRILVGRTSNMTSNSVATCHVLEQITDFNWTFGLHCNQTNKVGMTVYYTDTTNNLDCFRFMVASSTKFVVSGNGDVSNANNSYGSVSDVALKENIVDAKSQWNDIKNIKVRNFNFKESTGNHEKTMIGVVAQEVETVSPKLVHTNDDGFKEVSYSVLYMKAIKALQEAIAKIEVLETKVAALEAA